MATRKKKVQKTERLALELPPALKAFLRRQAESHGTTMKFICVRQLEAWRGSVERATANNPNAKKK